MCEGGGRDQLGQTLPVGLRITTGFGNVEAISDPEKAVRVER